MAVRLRVTVRPLAESELGAVEQRFPGGPLAKHRSRLACQEVGDAVYLIAWLAGVPVGHVLLRLGEAQDELVVSRVGNCAHLEDLAVVPERRSRGIGSRLLTAAEEAARGHGFEQVGLSVAVSNAFARGFYSRRGYKDSGIGKYPTAGCYIASDGVLRSRSDVSVYLVKRL
jgi:ribosomal protein S18 acetylase RimI-like enzyme